MEPEQQYQQDLLSGDYRLDTEQQAVVAKLQDIYNQLLTDSHQSQSWFRRWFPVRRQPVRGLYIWGGTGRGKTWLMDRFYHCIPFTEKYRVHFHRFMLDIHEQLRHLPKSPDPLNIVAQQLANKYRLLCLDEFHVHDIADAMLMAGLLKALFERGVTLIVTSNIAIDDLYKNGLQRERFMHAIELLHQYSDEMEMKGVRDYRLDTLEDNDNYLICEPDQGRKHLEHYFLKMAVVAPKHERALQINNRPISYLALADDLVWFDFRALCATYRSANDYIEIAKMFHTVFISDIFQMSDAHDDVAKRFIHLIDALYDHQVKVVISAVDRPAALYTGKRLAFAYERTVSRLTEMATERYLSLPHG